VTVASIPLGLAFYRYSTSDANQKPWITRLIEQHMEKESTWERMNAIHTVAAEQAAYDRHLFQSQNAPVTIDLMCPEYVGIFLVLPHFLFSPLPFLFNPRPAIRRYSSSTICGPLVTFLNVRNWLPVLNRIVFCSSGFLIRVLQSMFQLVMEEQI
jgi:hypothetical protein